MVWQMLPLISSSLFQSLMLVDSEPSSSNLGLLKRAAALLTAIWDSHCHKVEDLLSSINLG
jgi:hypothetical protein